MRYLIPVLIFITSCGSNAKQNPPDALIDNWHKAASEANFESYFSATTDNFVFLGTDPKERWTKAAFQAFSKPYFEKKETWDFSPHNRKWEHSPDNPQILWFDEQLDTWMEGCRGSGVVVREKGKWKLAYYNLTVLIENEKMEDFIALRRKGK